MSSQTNSELRLAGEYFLNALTDAQATVRQQVATERRGHAVAPDDAQMFDSYASDTVRERSVTLAVANIKADLKL